MSLYSSYRDLLGRNSNVIGVGSPLVSISYNSFTKVLNVVYNSVLGGSSYISFAKRNKLEKVNSAFGCIYDKKKLIEAGLYNENLHNAEDLELNWRLTKKLGYNLYSEPKAIVNYYSRQNVYKLMKQMYNYGYWRGFVIFKYKYPPDYSVYLLIASILILILLTIFSIFAGDLIYLAIPFIIYCVLILTTSLYQAITKKCNFIYLIMIYFTIHFSFFVGLLIGVIKGLMPSFENSK